MHSCGNVLALLPEFIDIGIDVMEFDSPHITGVENFKVFAEKRKMAFWLSSNIQSTFVHGTPQDVENEIKYYIKEVGNNGNIRILPQLMLLGKMLELKEKPFKNGENIMKMGLLNGWLDYIKNLLRRVKKTKFLKGFLKEITRFLSFFYESPNDGI
ncbi:MAG: hypothetical protein ACTSYC_07610 [Promethearchaeota archaeon]